MTVNIEHRFKYELSKTEIKRLNQLHLKYGLMWGYFKDNDESEIILAIHKNEIIGWGLIFFHEDKDHHEFHVYVSKNYRRLGIGSQIFNYAAEMYPEGLWVSKWNKRAEDFYNNFDIIEEDYDKD